MALSLGDLFNLRAKLHKHVYQHRIVKVIDHMVADALYEANPYFTVKTSGGKLIRMSECVDDDDGFCQLGDWLLNAIAASGDPQLEKAQSIIRRINERDLYPVIGMAMYAEYQKGLNEQNIKDGILNHCTAGEDNGKLRCAVEATLIVSIIDITFGSKDENGLPDDPINHMAFYNPKNTEVGAFKLPKIRMSPLFSPSKYSEQMVLVMVRDRLLFGIVKAAFDEWQESNDLRLGVAVPTHNTRKDESPGKGSVRTRSVIDRNSSFGSVEFHASDFPFAGLRQEPGAAVSENQQQNSQRQQSQEEEVREERRRRSNSVLSANSLPLNSEPLGRENEGCRKRLRSTP
ncbi:dendritic cell-derived IFNG-induced protein [Trypanosoma grayi]|uniref:dendritic cell-derived IFNG-induced protein n=1 Tax=Trypanosoma grayi TaxID=71804 RepID=UPI0004F4BBAA|nr:dendritic cell-derived IFNG-induced protein [Trypanosoma grayi]KEG09976.1 dendritic cell-derived IFNG-induced protein [Trypanosoma grayi]